MSNEFAPYSPKNGTFTVRNITNPSKTVKVFQYPIPSGQERDLLKIPGVSESDIHASLLKGELLSKLVTKDLFIVESDLNLIQFNLDQRNFLQENGVEIGLTVGTSVFTLLRKEDIRLIGAVDDVNTVFSIPSGKFIQDDNHKIIVYRNGVKQAFLDDFFIAESDGPGTGYDTVIMTSPPVTVPPPDDIITADYYILNT